MKDGRYFSKHFGCYVWVHVDTEKRSVPYDVCDCCGKPLKSFVSVTPESDGLEYLYGSECIKKIIG